MNIKLLITFVILCIAFTVNGLVIKAPKRINFNIKEIPLNINGWQGSLGYMDNLYGKILETHDIYNIQYNKNETKIQLSIVYYPIGQPAFHMPEGCVVGSGEKIIQKSSIKVKGAWENADMVYLKVMNNKGLVGHHLFAFATCERLYGDYMRFRFHMMSLGIRRNIQSCSLIRLSCYQDRKGEDVESILKSFWVEISRPLKDSMNLQK